jgi:hypothetical protein
VVANAVGDGAYLTVTTAELWRKKVDHGTDHSKKHDLHIEPRTAISKVDLTAGHDD